MGNENKMMTMDDIREPSWKKWVVHVPKYLNDQQCEDVCKLGRSYPPQESKIGHVTKGQGTNQKLPFFQKMINVNFYMIDYYKTYYILIEKTLVLKIFLYLKKLNMENIMEMVVIILGIPMQK